MKQKFDKIIHQLANAGIPLALAQINNRERNVIILRQAIINLLYREMGMTQCDIAELIHRAQPTINHFIKKHQYDYVFYEDYRQTYDAYKKNLSL